MVGAQCPRNTSVFQTCLTFVWRLLSNFTMYYIASSDTCLTFHCHISRTLEQRRQAMLQPHVSDQQFNCPQRCALYYRFDGQQFSSECYWLMVRVSLVKLPSDEYHWILLMISQHWCRWWLGAIRHHAITWANVDPDLCCHMASLDHNELVHEGYCSLLVSNWDRVESCERICILCPWQNTMEWQMYFIHHSM